MNTIQEKKISTALLLLVTIASPISLNIFLPILPELTAYYSSNYSIIQLSLTVYLVCLAAGQLMYGPLSDRYGRLPLLRAGMLIYLLGTLLVLLVDTVSGLILGRAAQALGASCGMVLARAMVSDTVGKEESGKILSYMAMAIAVGPVMAPLIGGLLATYLHWMAIFFLLLSYSVSLLVLSYLAFTETNNKKIPRMNLLKIMVIYKELIANKRYFFHMMMSMFLSAGFFVFTSGASYIVIGELGYSAGYYGMILMIIAIAYFCGGYLSSRLSLTMIPSAIIRRGMLLVMMSLVLWVALSVLLEADLVTLLVPMLVYALGRGMSEPNIVSVCIYAKPEAAGAAAGLLGAVQMVGSGLFSVLVPGAVDFGVYGLGLYLAALCLGAILSYLWVSVSTCNTESAV